MASSDPAQKQIVRQLVDWERIAGRCARYEAIGRAFPLNTLKKGFEKPPYYCHYLAWRLGTWENESLFARLEELLRYAEVLPNWEHERSLLPSADFADFWSLVWQLQVAEYLCEIGTEVRWSEADGGPDLSAQVGETRWFVECYTKLRSLRLTLCLPIGSDI